MLLFSLGKKEAVDSLICRIWGAPKCRKRPEQELFVRSGGIHGAARPRVAESTLGRRPQAMTSPPARLPPRRRAGEPAFLGSRVPWGGRSPKGSHFCGARDPAVQQRPPGGAQSARGSRGWGEGREVSVPEVAAAGASASSTRVAAAEEPRVLHTPAGTLRWPGKEGQGEAETARARKKAGTQP